MTPAIVRINQLRTMKIYRNSLSEMNYMFGQLAISLGDGMYLFCDTRFPNNYPKRIAIEMGDDVNAYCLFDYQEVIDYKSVSIEGRSGTGIALINNLDSIIEDAKAFKLQSLELGNVSE